MLHKKNKKFEDYRQFNYERTNIWISFGFEIFFVFIPYLVIWILIGKFWNNEKYHNYYNSLPLKDFMTFVISFSWILISLCLNFLSYIFKLQKEDSFTYTLGFSLILFSIIINDLWLLKVFSFSNPLVWFIRIVMVVVFGVIGIFIGTVTTSLIRNQRFKIEEENEQLLIAFENGEKIPSIDQIRIKKAKEYRLKRDLQKKELVEFKEKLDIKVQAEIDKKLKEKLDAKEDKKRRKKKNKNTF